MKTLITITDQDIYSGAPIVDRSNFRMREASRAVVSDGAGRIALLKVNKHNYHKLPGGGIEPGENIAVALDRELLEEIGCRVAEVVELGSVVEFRDKFRLNQISYAFKAAKVGESRPPAFTQGELAGGFEIVWAKDLESAISLLESDEPNNYEGQFIKRRDLAILKAAKQ